MIQIICLGLLVFIAVIVVAGFNKLYSMDARINKLFSGKEFKKDFLIALGWKRYNHILWYRIKNELWTLDDAYTVALRESKQNNNS